MAPSSFSSDLIYRRKFREFTSAGTFANIAQALVMSFQVTAVHKLTGVAPASSKSQTRPVF